MREEI